ncbi:MAG: putative glycoside hydrolase [Treponemataceae bacterium]|nr:MAG: putative glycoside hydrolase [Treponemataceae bacterium]
MKNRFALSLFFFVLLFSVRFHGALFAQTLPLYQLPENLSPKNDSSYQNIVVASESGIYKITGNNTAVPIWTEGKATHISYTTDSEGEMWIFVTSKGLLKTRNLQTFENIDGQIPPLTIKEYNNGTKSIVKQVQTLKDFFIDPINPANMVSATKDTVFLSRDGGKNWKDIGYSGKTAGTKAVAVATIAGDGAAAAGAEVVVFLSNALYGLSYYRADAKSPTWVDIKDGFDKVPSMGYADEISDIEAVPVRNASGGTTCEIFLSQTFMPCIYRLNWTKKVGEKLYRRAQPALTLAGAHEKEYPDTIDSLEWTGRNLIWTSPAGISSFDISAKTEAGAPAESAKWLKAIQSVPEPVFAIFVPKKMSGYDVPVVIGEVWMLKPETVYSPYATIALDKKSVYMPANRGADDEGITTYINLVEKNKLNSIVIDMKDDYGLLRYDTNNAVLKERGRVSGYAVKLEHFVSRFKEKNVYLIARIPVFKDKHLAAFGGAKYAVWNTSSNRAWQGIKGGTGAETEYYDEFWVDPYCEDVWEYNVLIAKELIARGFDEIQFDYIRFPTDGTNLYQAAYRWRDAGMDKESAIISFLKYARKNIDAPIGIDIYGANGWYRSGTRTGQDMELLAEYVDIICPMFYPSHFEQAFLAYAPAVDRPYRVYYFGSYRASVIARNQVIIRPWAQAFYLNVSYDRQYYNADAPRYVRAQIYGVRDSINRGYMYWNNSGRYGDIEADISETAPYAGESGVLTPFRQKTKK